ncbi:MAG: amidase [Polyangiaceae bacterium]
MVSSASSSFRDRIESALARLADPSDPARRSFVSFDPELARRSLTRVEQGARAMLPEHEGLTLSVKDLFDVEGQVSTAGSRARAELPAAVRTASAVSRLIDSGCVLLGRTVMTELAYSGVGWNPHFGTPLNPWDRTVGRIPGGSSSGAAVSVADGLCDIGLGTDTGGSVRIPAALCGLLGFKPTASRTPRDGAVPLSSSLDSVGPITRLISVLSWADAVLAGEPDPCLAVEGDRRASLSGLTFGLPDRWFLDDLEPVVSHAFFRSIRQIEKAGARLVSLPLPVMTRVPELQRNGGIAAYEASRAHASLIESKRALIDPRVVTRLDAGAHITDHEYGDLVVARSAFIREFWRSLEGVDALLMPTVPIVASRFDEIAFDEGFFRINRLLLRNTSVINLADGCAITIPCQLEGEPPVGLSMAAAPLRDRSLIASAWPVVASLCPSMASLTRDEKAPLSQVLCHPISLTSRQRRGGLHVLGTSDFDVIGDVLCDVTHAFNGRHRVGVTTHQCKRCSTPLRSHQGRYAFRIKVGPTTCPPKTYLDRGVRYECRRAKHSAHERASRCSKISIR